MGIRLQASDGSKLEWARENGGEGGSHPSNILDNAYSLASVNINGDTPVILTNEGPDMGGYLCLCTVARAERYALSLFVYLKRYIFSNAHCLKVETGAIESRVNNPVFSDTLVNSHGTPNADEPKPRKV